MNDITVIGHVQTQKVSSLIYNRQNLGLLDDLVDRVHGYELVTCSLVFSYVTWYDVSNEI